ncbi:hypothetical protein BGZ95_009436 [Linnemannia exigua]|uniref:C2H2-type domain-containing protein n=1 Tax=Linnemannia exigua TaxID=604196 RepID=A0AAD4H6R0_9FUNG|nr:hypothetical protein BGZ95_009436 [Linnemannia exigua]
MSSYAINVPVATIGQATTCLTCGIRLPSLETQQLHHKSDWHTYNLKRKMVGLPPVPAEVFAQLVTASREQANPEEVPQPECVPCSKKYLSFQAYENHLQSKKHKQIAAAYAKKQQDQEQNATSRPTEDDITASSSSPKETTTTTTASAPEQRNPSETVCLFCSHESTDALGNYGHMRATHGFFLPSFERLIDLEGMLAYLADKLVENLDCLWCTPSVFSTHLRPDQELNARFANLASVRRHMVDKGHCKLAMEHGAEREYADFYLPEDSFDSDDEEGLEDAEQHKESSQEDSSMDEDEQRLNMVLLDDEGNWILDEQASNNSGIRIDPVTNELVLNNRRLAHKDAARRQKVESRTVILASSRPNHRRPEDAQEGPEQQSGEQGANSTSTEVLLSSDVHHPKIKLSNSLLKSQNQLSGSNNAVSVQQRQELAVLNANSQNFESTKRERMATLNAIKANVHSRRRFAATYGTNN